MAEVYVSITGLRLKAFWHTPRFWSLAVPAMGEAHRAPGNLHASARTIGGIHHTLSVWENEKAMRAYLIQPHHRAAMRAFHGIATGKTIGFTSNQPPNWAEARRIWEEQAQDYLSA